MFSKILKKYFDTVSGGERLISASDIEVLMKKYMGYSFSRQFVSELLKKYESGGMVIAVITTDEVVGKRTKYTYESIIEVLEYLLVCESISGLIRGNVKENRISIIADSKMWARRARNARKSPNWRPNYPINMRAITFVGDMIQRNLTSEDASKYNPAIHGERALSLDRRCTMGFFFFSCWLGDESYPDFYRDWRIFKNRVLAEDPYAKEDDGFWVGRFNTKIEKMAPIGDATNIDAIPLFNRHIVNKKWNYGRFILNSVGDLTKNSAGNSLKDSISVLDAFFRTADNEDRLKVRDWMEIIVTYENGSHWVVEEAKAALKLHVPSLDQESLIDDWWMLSIIYLGLNGEITKKTEEDRKFKVAGANGAITKKTEENRKFKVAGANGEITKKTEEDRKFKVAGANIVDII